MAQPQVHATKFDNWYYRCFDGKAADGGPIPSCEVAQIATVKQGEQSVNGAVVTQGVRPA